MVILLLSYAHSSDTNILITESLREKATVHSGLPPGKSPPGEFPPTNCPLQTSELEKKVVGEDSPTKHCHRSAAGRHIFADQTKLRSADVGNTAITGFYCNSFLFPEVF